MTKDEALKQALEALEEHHYGVAQIIIREALAQPQQEQESVAMADYMALMKKYVALKAAQPQRKPLTDKQILADETLRYYFGLNGGAGPVSKQGRKVVDAIEAAHGIKE